MRQPKFVTEGLRSFFEQFASRGTAPDVAGLAAMYAGQVLIAGPAGSQVVTPAQLLHAIPSRQQLLASAGHRQTELVACEEMPLTDRYSLVRAEFRWTFHANGDPSTVTLPSTYIVDRSGTAPKIVVYMNEQDVVSVLRERNLLPAQ